MNSVLIYFTGLPGKKLQTFSKHLMIRAFAIKDSASMGHTDIL